MQNVITAGMTGGALHDLYPVIVLIRRLEETLLELFLGSCRHDAHVHRPGGEAVG